MVKSFATPPLVELIAELRWLPGGMKVSQNDSNSFELQPSMFLNPQNEELYLRFAQLIAAHGYTQIERLVPSGIPSIPFTPTYRYRDPKSSTVTLYHLGVGVFSAHTTPPYQSWNEFKPVVERGIGALMEALGEKVAPPAFNSVLLRYIDNFTETYTQGKSLDGFLKQLGIDVRVPDAISKHLASGKEIQPRVQLALPLKSGMHMQLSFADGKAGAHSGILMDTVVSATTPVNANVNDVMTALEEAHKVTHETFVELTVSLYPLMKPVNG